MSAVFTNWTYMVGLFTTDQAIVEMATFILVTMTSLLLNGYRFLVYWCASKALDKGRSGATIMAIYKVQLSFQYYLL